MTNKPERTPVGEQGQGRTYFGMNTVRWQRLCVSLRQESAVVGILFLH